MNDHWQRRVAERIGNVDPETLHHGLVWAIKNGRSDLVQFVTRVSKDGRRIFKFRVPDGRYFFAMVKTPEIALITVLPEGFKVNRQGRNALELAP